MYDSVKDANFQVSKDIFPAEAWELISQNRESDDLVIMDVSTPQEYEVLHLEGDINVSLLSRFFKARMDIMNKNKTYVVYCKVKNPTLLLPPEPFVTPTYDKIEKWEFLSFFCKG